MGAGPNAVRGVALAALLWGCAGTAVESRRTSTVRRRAADGERPVQPRAPTADSPAAEVPEDLEEALAGLATYYGPGFHGRRTASGERFDSRALTAAHRTLRFGTRVRVTSVRTGRSVVVRINDRGPFGRRERIIDLSVGAARRIGLDRAGVMQVRLEIVP